MSVNIKAIYEEGVFKPLQKINIKEHENVEIKIFIIDEWRMKFNSLIKKIQKNTSQHSSEEIENDITEAIKEVREEKE